MTSVIPSNKQDGLLSSGKKATYNGLNPDATHIWIPADGKPAKVNGHTNPGLERTFSLSGVKKGSTLTIHNINYTVRVRSKGCCGKTENKAILKGIDGIFRPGMNAILGPTGSGKSSLLDVLAGRKDPSGLSGTLLLDGCPPPENFKCMVGYVVQDDVVMGTLSVKENFHFSAALRLPSSVTSEEREERVKNVINELGLQHCANTKVGNEFIRGVSGGERKRCNIGMELIISPPVLFLDEPTTGLDANTANTVMLLLKTLSMRGGTIVFSIHQPRYSIYRLFDNLVLLSMGELVYHGPCDESLLFFQSIGYSCEEHNNPPDFFLDVINGDPNATTSDINKIISTTDMETISQGGEEEKVHDKLVAAYKMSPWRQKLELELNPILEEHNERLRKWEIKRLPPVEFATGAFTQVLQKHNKDNDDKITKPILTDVLKEIKETDAQHSERLFGKNVTTDDVVAALDEDFNEKVDLEDLAGLIERNSAVFQEKFVGYQRTEINGAISFFSTILSALMTQVDRTNIEDDDIKRTVGINTRYVGTTDFQLEQPDKDFLIKQERQATESFLRCYVQGHSKS